MLVILEFISIFAFMTRLAAIISCVIATLFLIGTHAECAELSESYCETEMECCPVSYGQPEYEIAGEKCIKLELSSPGYVTTHNPMVTVSAVAAVKKVPSRVLYCVFRE